MGDSSSNYHHGDDLISAETWAMSFLKVNSIFASYKELREALDGYENENRVQFWKRDAKKIKIAEQHAPHIYQVAKKYPELEYYYLKFACIHGGQAFRPNVSCFGRRRKNRGTWKQECKAEISVSLTKDRSALIVNNIVNNHNHKIPSVEEYKQLPKQRRKLEDYQIKKREQLKKFKAKKTPSQSPSTNSPLKDILRRHSSSRSNNFRKITNLLVEKYHCEVSLQMDEEERIFGFFFQDPHMKIFYEYFPEVFYLDGTYRLQNINCYVYTLSVENSFGTTDVIGVAVLTVEGRNSVQWMLEKFKETNPNWKKTKVIVADKFTSENHIVQEQFPDACPLICQSHAFLIFKKEIKPPKLDVTYIEAKKCLQYLERLMRSSSLEDYNTILEEMVDHAPYSVVDYFYKNWHESRVEWSNAFAKKYRPLINGKLESPNSKVKSAVCACKNFNEFIEKLFAVLEFKRQNFKNEFSRMIFKIPKEDEQNRLWIGYYQQLTLFAVTKIEAFLKSEKQYALKQEGCKIICKTQNKSLVLTETSCTCHFFTVIKLPCKHVLFYRKTLNMNLFNENLFAERWTKTYMRSAFGKLLLAEKSSAETNEKVTNVTRNDKIKMETTIKNEENNMDISEHIESEEDEEVVTDRVREARAVCSTLTKLCNEACGGEFLRRLNLLRELKYCWEKGHNSVVIISGEERHLQTTTNINLVLKENPLMEIITESDIMNDHDYIC